jgi:hypothetical protein
LRRGGPGTLAFLHPAKKLLASSSLSPSWLRSSLHTPVATTSLTLAAKSSIERKGSVRFSLDVEVRSATT